MAAGGRLVGPTLAALAAVALLAAAPAHGARPNVVVIVTDDQTRQALNRATMPQTIRRIAARGTSFRQAVVATPQCCPSRAGFLTGQYPQNNGVVANRPGYPLLEHKGRVLPSWLQAAGYRTIHIGKYLNGYALTRGADPAPGWDRWIGLIREHYDNPLWSIDGRVRDDEDRYLTATINRMATRMIRRGAAGRKPFYLQVDHFAPHVQAHRNRTGRCRNAAVPEARDATRFETATAPRNPAVNEADVGDKPAFIRDAALLDAAALAEVDRHYGCALAALRSVDRGVRDIVRTLARSGELRRTMIVFTSDNGYSFGEHRMALSKGLPYEEHLRVPLLIRPPRDFPRSSRRGASTRAPVANIDLAPTILRLADARPCTRRGRGCRRIDGRSLLPLMRGRKPGWVDERAIRTFFSINGPSFGRSCQWDGLRSPKRMYVEHRLLPDGSNRCRPASESEYYDLKADRFQLEGDREPPFGIARRLDRLRRCSGIRGRDGRIRGRPFCE